MNKFNLGLHSALFYLDWEKSLANPDIQKNVLSQGEIKDVELDENAKVAADERDTVIDSSKKEQSGVVDDATKAQSTLEHVDNVFGYGYSNEVLNAIYKRKNDWTLDREKVKQIQWRIAEDVRLWNIWEKNIQEWYKHLLKTLLDNKYFHNPFHKNEEEIRKMYTREIESQYEKHVWNADDKVFGKTKGKLFWQGMPDYPANVVYKKLNDTEIFAREVWNKQAYTVEAQNTENVKENLAVVEAQEWGDKKRFLSRDLPNYLWETKDTSVFSKILQWTPIISKSNERKSAVDKKWISDFMDAVSKISVGWWEKPELALLEAFKDAQTNWTDYQWQEKLAENDIYVQTERDMRKIIDAWRFYVRSQRVGASVEDQHNLYLSILGIIEHEWWVDEAIAQFMDDVNAHKENKIAESKKQNEKDWEMLQNKNAELYNIANKFNQRYTRALRLSDMDESSFSRSAVDILSDLNNDGTLTYADKWVTKTWFEFKRIVDMVGEKDAINHLIDQAKIMNDTMGLGLTKNDLNAEEIKKWNKKLILVLQNIISQPWGDLYPLLVYGTDSAKKYKEAFDRLPESKDDPVVLAATDELLKDIKLEDLQKIQWVENPTDREWVRQAVAWRLFAEYTRWVWLGGSLSFDEWVKWVSLNGWIQASESGASIWLTLAYNPQINLWKWRTVTPGASFWFVPLFNTSAWWSVEVAKEWINKNSIAERIWVRWWFTEVFGIAHVYSVSAGRSRDKLAGIEWDRRNIAWQFNEQIMTPLLNSIAEKLWESKVLNLEDEAVRSQVKEAISAQVEKVLDSEDKSKLKQWDKEKLIDNTMRFLSFFDKANLSNEDVRKAIANKMAEQYSYAREDHHLNDIDGKTYLSGARLWFSWVQLWVYGVWVIHAWLSFTKHEHDIYGDRKFGTHTLRWAERFKNYSSWNEEMIAEFNKNLPEGKEISLNPEWYVVIPQNLFRDAYINPGMKWLIKKDESGNVLLHPRTHIDLPTSTYWAATESLRINIWWFAENMIKLSNLTSDRFTVGQVEVSRLSGRESVLTMDFINKALDDIKKQNPNDEILEWYNFDKNLITWLDSNKWYKIVLERKWDHIEPHINPEWEWLVVEYIGLSEKLLMSKEAQKIADNVYEEAWKVTTNMLFLISHKIEWKHEPRWDYTKFASAIKNMEYDNAKEIILRMLPTMDKEINKKQRNKVNFSKIIDDLKNLEGAELGKALMSINNVFARVSSVHWWQDGEYHFWRYNKDGKWVERTMGDITEARAGEIIKRINESGIEEAMEYVNLIKFAEKYKTIDDKHIEYYKATHKKPEKMANAIWINLGNPNNFENPLFNPEVYWESVIDLKDAEFEWKDILKGRALKTIAKNAALLHPILIELWFEEEYINELIKNKKPSNEDLKYEEWKLQISLDIDGKNVIVSLDADMKFAYFAQCVNHMLVLDNIKASIPWGWSAEFGPSVMWDGNINEWIVGNMFTSSKTSGDIAFTAFRKGPEEEPDWDTTPGEKEEPIDNPDWDTKPWEIEEPTNPDWNSNPGQTPWEWWGGTPEVGWEWNNGTQWGWETSWGNTNPETWGGNNGWQNWWADNNQNGWQSWEPEQWGEGQTWWWSWGRD